MLLKDLVVSIFGTVFKAYLKRLEGLEQGSPMQEKLALQFFFDLVYFGKVLVAVDVNINSDAQYKSFFASVRSHIDPIDLVSMDKIVFKQVERFIMKMHGLYGVLFPETSAVD
jgi:hypothetical protein